jgi:U3 small nucleolar RNA-associated protein 12
MEAIELYREETAKMKEHRAICKAAGKEVGYPLYTAQTHVL